MTRTFFIDLTTSKKSNTMLTSSGRLSMILERSMYLSALIASGSSTLSYLKSEQLFILSKKTK